MTRKSKGRGDLNEVFTFYTVATADGQLTNYEYQTLSEIGKRYGRFEWITGIEDIEEARQTSIKMATIECDHVSGADEKGYIKRNNTDILFTIVAVHDDGRDNITTYQVEYHEGVQDVF